MRRWRPGCIAAEHLNYKSRIRKDDVVYFDYLAFLLKFEVVLLTVYNTNFLNILYVTDGSTIILVSKECNLGANNKKQSF
jgi:hypothetical protein